MLDFSDLLLPIDEDKPCGENLRSSELFFEMMDAKGGGERQSFSGDGTGAGEKDDSDWKSVKKSAIRLLNDTHDLEIATLLTSTLLHTDGFSGLASGLQLIRKLLEQYWDCVYPELDMDYPDEPGEQAFERINTLAVLGATQFKLSIRKHPVISHNVLGQFSLNDIQIAHSEKPPEDAHKPEHIEGAFIEVGQDAIKEIRDFIKTSIIESEMIENIFKEKAGSVDYPDLSGLHSTLREIQHILTDKIQGEEPEETGSEEGDMTQATAGNSTQDSAPKFNAGQINNREDVVTAIDKICEYYQKNEPGSPIPLLLERAKRLVDKEFLEILEDLSPDGVNQAQNIFGV